MTHWDDLPALAAAARRGLPEHDPAVDALDDDARAIVARSWADRAERELGAAAGFAAMCRNLFEAGVTHDTLWLAARATCDEMRHSEICRYVASRYAGRDVPRPAARPAVDVRFGDADASLSRVLHAVVSSCMSESIGSAFLRVCVEQARGALVEAALRELLHDEIDHGRIGFALLASLDVATRTHVENALPVLLRMARTGWFERAEVQPNDAPKGHGCLSPKELRALVDDALSQLVLPGFAHVGLDVREAARWLDAASRHRDFRADRTKEEPVE